MTAPGRGVRRPVSPVILDIDTVGIQVIGVITVVADPGLDESALAAAVELSLCRAGVTGAHVTISHAEAITRDPRTGKTRRFVAAGADR
jgi:hypothetical protein